MTDPTLPAWSRENDLLFQLRRLREENEQLREDQQGVDAVDTLTEEGWTWDGDQWQRPAQPAVINMENFVGSGKPVVLPSQPVSHAVIAGALFDFMGWLTSRKERLVLSSADEASPAVDAIRDFAKMRGLSLDDAKVLDWHTTPPQRPWAGLTDEEIENAISNGFARGLDDGNVPNKIVINYVRVIEATLKERNT